MTAAAFKVRDKLDTVDHRKPSVLYAEDQTSARLVTTALLQKLGYQVDAVEDGECALSKAMAGSYDVILLDIEMPVMDGVTAAQRIRSESPYCSRTPVLALSAYLADTTEQNGWRHLFDHALPKPATGAELEAAIKTVIELRMHESRQDAVSHPVAQVTLSSFEHVLPRPMWDKLVGQAADDLHCLALTASAAADADDQSALQQALGAFRALARSFGAYDAVLAAEALFNVPSSENSERLVLAVVQWSAGSRQL
jgi:CheY-like chemotaxis protein